MKCEFCGRDILDDAKFCPGCGEHVIDAVEDEELFPMKAEHSDPLAEETEILDSVDDVQTTVLSDDTYTAAESTNKPNYLLIAAAAAAAICVGGYLGFKTSNASDPQVVQSQGPVIVYDKKILTAKGNKIQEVKEDGSEAETFYEGKDQIDNLVSDNNNVYFTEGKDIVKLEPKQDKTEVIHDGSDDTDTPHDINVIDDKVYFNDDETIKEVDKDGKNEKDVLEGKDDIKSQLNLDGMIILDNKAYFTGQGNNKNTGAIYELDLTTGEEYFLYSPEHCSDLNCLTVLPDHVYFIQEDTYEGPYHIYEMDRKADSKVIELAVTANSDETFNNLVILDGKAYFTKTTGEGVAICSLNIADKKVLEISKISDNPDFIVDELGIANGKLYYSRAGKLFYVNADKTDQKPEDVKEETTLYNNVANAVYGDAFVADSGDIYYLSFNSLDGEGTEDEMPQIGIFRSAKDKLSEAKQIMTLDNSPVSWTGDVQMLKDRPVFLYGDMMGGRTGIFYVGDDPRDEFKAVVLCPMLNCAGGITAYAVAGDDIYYGINNEAFETDHTGLYKFDTNTKTSEKINSFRVDEIVNVDGCIYVVGHPEDLGKNSLYKLVDGKLEIVLSDSDSGVNKPIFSNSMIYFECGAYPNCVVKRCNLQGEDAEVIYSGQGRINSMTTYNDRLYIFFEDGDRYLGAYTSSLMCCDMDGENLKPVLENKLDGINKIAGSVPGGLILNGDGSTKFLNLENESLEPLPSFSSAK